MNNKATRLISKKGLFIDLFLTAVWFVFFTFQLRPHVPAQSQEAITFFSLFTAACLSGVFWLALSMFRIVLVDEIRRKASTHK